ncbi:MAG: hypothetical protein OH335_04755 [Candidatus Parvarchaeota archaeon]|nr:hypothetical protein [Candidatus Jingweiarchaeum tengchongense]MCW1306056.1 hypothetical protein [Candidatus Jingweiarchaeum tengchongense]
MPITYIESVKKALSWIENNMLTFDGGLNGVYERIRIDKHIRTNWVRPDCNAEIARDIALYKIITGDEHYTQIYRNIVNWLMRVQDNDPLSAWYGTFPFYLVDGYILPEYVFGSMGAHSIFPNDNGKILVCLIDLYRYTKEPIFLDSAVKLANYWISIQREDGTFSRRDGRTVNFKGPCFILWLYTGLIMLYKETNEEKYKIAFDNAYTYIKKILLKDNRIRTSFEISKTEDWRPVSSELSIALYALSRAYDELKDVTYLDDIEKTGTFLLSFQDKSGGIINCKDEACNSTLSLQNNSELVDLVYTQGFALIALVYAWKSTLKTKYKDAANKLANFLITIQCKNESPLWDGAWRGSFNIHSWKWDGRANQNNPTDEGGMFSVYSGWSTANIIYGLLLLSQL